VTGAIQDARGAAAGLAFSGPAMSGIAVWGGGSDGSDGPGGSGGSSGSGAGYTFLPWVRRGVSRSLTGAVAASGPGRVSLTVAVEVNGTPVDVPMALHGPGDAIGLDPAAIARVDPTPGATDAEPSLFAAIEIVPADLPWLLTPGGPDGNGRLMPWLALVVVSQSAGRIGTAPDGGLDRLEVASAELPPPAEAWAWAHAQVLGSLTGSAADSLDAEPGRWRARILSPRRLDPGSAYLAALVPVFAAGAASGLGAPAPAQPLAPAWDPAAAGSVTLPVYHWWSFATSPDGDFETLARRLVGRDLPPGVGRLPVDFSQPGTGVRGAAAGLSVEGALGRIGDTVDALPPDGVTMSDDIAALVARTASPLVVGPPYYGPVATPRGGDPPAVPAAGWQHEVNADPRVRAITGVGAAVIRQDQDALVASAWRQVGDLPAANRVLGWLGLAKATGAGLYRRHFVQASVGTLAQWSAPAQSQVQMNQQVPITLAAIVATTTVSPASLGTAARRLLRPTGPLVTRALAGIAAVADAAAAAPATGPTIAAGPAPVAPARIVARRPPIFGGGVIVMDPGPQTDAPPGLVTLERIRQLMGGPADLSGFGWDGLTSALVRERSLLRIATALVDQNGNPSGLPPNSHGTFAAAAEPTQDGILAELATARRPFPAAGTASLDRGAILTALDPAPRFAAIATRRVTAPPQAGTRDPLDPVLIAPSYPQPAVDSLAAIAPELVLPGLDAVPANTVTLATTDQRFVEAFLLGMNHELERELRWRGFPTAPGSTSFRRFWDSPPGQADITGIAGWATDSALGSHGPAGTSGSDTVLVVRGDLVRRFPGIAITAIPLVNGAPDPNPANELSPVLRGALDPDLLYAGFAFPPTQAAEFAYVLTQQPGAPRFGLDADSTLDASSVTLRTDLAWSQLGQGTLFASVGGPLAGRDDRGPVRLGDRGLGSQCRGHGMAHPAGAGAAGHARSRPAGRHEDGAVMTTSPS
jgi:hypothetical protein